MKELNERLVSSRIGEMPVNGLPGECLEKKEYMPPKTKRTLVEAEGGFCGSIQDENTAEKPSIIVNEQKIGADTDYFNNEDGTTNDNWDY